MKRISIVFLQIIIVFIGIAVLAALIWFPLIEGRANNLDLLSIYIDKFILYVYIASIPFFIALYKTFKLLGYIVRSNVFSPKAANNLKSIKYCAILLSILIVAAGLYIKLFHNTEDDPAGFLAICVVTTFISLVIATIAGRFEKRCRML